MRWACVLEWGNPQNGSLFFCFLFFCLPLSARKQVYSTQAQPVRDSANLCRVKTDMSRALHMFGGALLSATTQFGVQRTGVEFGKPKHQGLEGWEMVTPRSQTRPCRVAVGQVCGFFPSRTGQQPVWICPSGTSTRCPRLAIVRSLRSVVDMGVRMLGGFSHGVECPRVGTCDPSPWQAVFCCWGA